MDPSPHNIQRITKLIQSEVDYNFLNPGYTIAFNDDQVLLEQNDNELKHIYFHCLLVPRYPMFFKCGHLTCLLCLKEYRNFCLKKYYLVQFASNLAISMKSIHIKWRRINVRTLFQ